VRGLVGIKGANGRGRGKKQRGNGVEKRSRCTQRENERGVREAHRKEKIEMIKRKKKEMGLMEMNTCSNLHSDQLVQLAPSTTKRHTPYLDMSEKGKSLN